VPVAQLGAARADVQVHAELALVGPAHEAVVAVPDARRIGIGVCAVEALGLARLAGRRGDQTPLQGDPHAVGAEGAQRVERLCLLGGGAVHEQVVVLERRLLQRRRRRASGRDAGRQHGQDGQPARPPAHCRPLACR
jgi:hypothetical protein